jgi:N-formylglutamate amidohydrolase
MAPDLVAAAEGAVREAGFTVARNAPYAGGHITAHHARPAGGIHALQIEIDRSAYLAPDLRSPGAGFDRTARLLASVVRALTAQALGSSHAVAAE